MTDIASDAIKWLCDDPTFSTEHRATIAEVLKALGAEDPDDPLLVALVIEGVDAERGAPTVVATVTGWTPELCGEDAKRRHCTEPVSGTGRCMACGSQRFEPVPVDPAIKAAQMSDKEPETRPLCSVCGCLIDEGNYPLPDGKPRCQPCYFLDPNNGIEEAEQIIEQMDSEPVMPLDAAPPVTPHVHRSARDKRIRRPTRIKAHVHIDAPSAGAVETMKAGVTQAVDTKLPLMWRIKKVTGLSDDDLGLVIGRKRATVQAYAQSNRTEVLGPNQLDALGEVLRMHYDVLADLLLEIEAAKCPS
jgi:hypothetical protein